MARLNKDELIAHRAWLSQWRLPAEMTDYVNSVGDGMGAAVFFRQGGVEFLRDAWLAGEFGNLRRSKLVRLVPERDRWPDFDAQDEDGLIERVECAEADIPGRRRGDEYSEKEEGANHEPLVEDDPVENWIMRADQVPTALAAVIATKVQKRYAKGASLLIYLNIGEFGIRQKQIEAAMAQAVNPALANFQRVWILWKSKLYGPWSS